MKYITTLDNFISPQNGMMLLDYQHILEGDRVNKSYISPTLIDIRLEMINLRQDLDGIIGDSGATFILQTTSDQFENAQALNALTPGMMKQTSGVVATAISGKDYMPGLLTNDYVWVGKKIGPDDNVPTEVKAEDILGYFNLSENNIWVGNSSNKAIEASKIPPSVLPSVSWGAILRGNFSNELEETRNYIQGPTIPGIYGNLVTWGIDDGGVAPVVLGRSIGDSGVSLAEFTAAIEESVSAAASSAEAAAASAEAAAASAEAAAASSAEAVAAAAEATEAAASATISAGEASASAGAAFLSAGEATIAAGSASSSASSASSSASDASDSASSASSSASSAAASLSTLLSVAVLKAGSTMTGALILNGDPTVSNQAATKAYVDSTAGGTGTVTSVGLTTATDGLTISSSPVTSSGNINIDLNTELQSLSAISSNGIVARTGSGTYSSRTITAGSILISVINGDGVSGNPTIDLNQDNITRFSSSLIPLSATSTQSFSFDSVNATTNYKIANTSTASMPTIRKNQFLLENSGSVSLGLHFWTATSDTGGYGTFRMAFKGTSSTITPLQIFYSPTDSNYFFQLTSGAGFNSYVNFYGNLVMQNSSSVDFSLSSDVKVPVPTLSSQAATKGYVDSSVSGLGTVSSVGATTTSSGLTITGSPITTSGSFTFTLSSGLQDLSSYTSASFLKVSNNLSDLGSPSTARTNLGLTNIATQSVTANCVLVGATSNGITSIAAPANNNRVLLSGASSSTNPAWSTATYPATTTANRILYSGSNNIVSEINTANDGVLITNSVGIPSISSILPSAVQLNITSLGTIGTGTWSATNIALNKGGSNASLTASNGGIVYSTASAMAILSGTATASKLLMSGASTTPSWSSSTYPSSVTAGQILYGSASNVISGLTSSNNGLLVTNSSGVPSISSRYVDDTSLGNVFLGTSTGNNTTTGSFNTGIGTLCLNLLTSGSSNISLGFGVGKNLTSGSDNVCIGSGNILYPAFLNSTTSSGCVAIGHGAGHLRASYTNSVFLGRFADAASSGLSNVIAIGNNASASTSNTCVIGDTSSGMKLVLGSTTGYARIHVVGGVNNVGSEDSCIRATSATNAKIEIENTTASTGKLYEIRSNPNGDFDIVDRTGLTQRFSIKTTGTCGIATGSPLGKLHVTGSYNNYSNNGTIIRATDSAASANIEIQNSGTGGSIWAIRAFNSVLGLDGQFDIADMTNSRRVMIFDSSGRVGVGMVADQLFSVNTANPSKVGSGSWTGISDARFKDVCGVYSSGLKEILEIVVKKFKYNKKSGHPEEILDSEHVGIIAQEIEKILPETVKKVKARGLEDARMFDMTNITYALINAVKELNNKVINLENKLSLNVTNY